MTLSDPAQVRRLGGSAAVGLAAGAASLVLAYAIEGQASGSLNEMKFFALVFALPLLLVGVLRPTWPLLVVIAVPPGLVSRLGFSDTRILVLVLAAVLASHQLRRGSIRVSGGLPAIALVVVVTSAFVDRVPLFAPAALEASYVRDQVILYLVVLLLAGALAHTGELQTSHVAAAFTVCALVTVAILIGQVHGSPSALRLTSPAAPSNPGFDFHRTHFGYLVAAGFGLSLAGLLTSARHRGVLLASTAVLGLATATSFARGGWMSAALLLILLPWLTGRRTYWLLLPVPVFLFATVGAARERLLGDVQQGIGASIASGQLGSNRLLLWRDLWERAVHLPWGRGFGYMWSLTPDGLTGIPTIFQTANPFVYAHNDFLFWTVELGLVGLCVWLLLWAAAWRRFCVVLRTSESVVRQDAILALTPLLVMLVASLFDNAVLLPEIATPFFAVVGILGAQVWKQRHRHA